jgi:hypothetical protein
MGKETPYRETKECILQLNIVIHAPLLLEECTWPQEGMGTETVLKVGTNENGADQNVSLISPIRLNVAYSMGWSALHGAETETHFLKMVANLRDKRTAIAIMPAKNRAFAIFPPPPLIFSLVPPFKFADFFLIRLALLN